MEERHRIDLALPLLIIKETRGILACGYLDITTCSKAGDAAAIVTGVKDFDAMLDAKVVAVSEQAKKLGVREGMSGTEALERMR